MSRYAILGLVLLLSFATIIDCLLTREKLVTISDHVVEQLQHGINSTNTTEDMKVAMARPEVTLKQILQKYPFLISIADRLARIEENVWYIENAYNHLLQFSKKFRSNKPSEAKYTARAFLDISDSVENIFTEVTEEKPPKKASVFSVFATNLNPRVSCISEKSSEYMINSLFKIVCYAEVHALIVEWNSIKILERLHQEVGVDKEELVSNFKMRLLQIWDKADASLKNVTSSEEKCEYEEEEDYSSE